MTKSMRHATFVFGVGMLWYRAIYATLFLFCGLVQEVQSQVTANVFRRVLLINAGKDSAGKDSFGTSFTIDVDGRQYLITAKHVVANLKDEDIIQIHKDNKWPRVKVKILRAKDPIDIAVLIPPEQLTVSFPLEPTMAGMQFGQDVFFAGFPFAENLFTTAQMPDLYPIPFVKKGIISAEAIENGANILYLDGHNNPGFSGGPIVFRDFYQKGFVFKVAGVIGGYRFDIEPVFETEEITPEQITPEDITNRRLAKKNGRILRLTELKNVVKSNTGIVRGNRIDANDADWLNLELLKYKNIYALEVAPVSINATPVTGLGIG